MKKSFVLLASAAVFALCTSSCSTVGELLGVGGSSSVKIAKPSFSLGSVAISSLDLEGITFRADYTVKNPYPVSLSVQKISADVMYNSGSFTTLNTVNGLKVRASSSSSNAFTFKVPYNSILTFAKSASGKTALPFQVKGSAVFDLSSIPYMSGQNLSIPFSQNFNVPVFKPELSASNFRLKMPSLSDVTKAFSNSGMNAVQAASAAASMVARRSVDENVLKKINLNLDMTFDMNVANKGSAAWEYGVKNCSVMNGSDTLASVNTADSGKITGKSSVIPMKVTLNTVKAGSFIAQIINRSGSAPVLDLDSALSFPGMSYAPNLPLRFTQQLSPKAFGIN
jgi:hypothetical protein